MTLERDIDHLIKLAAENIDHGVIEEPRFYFDQITLQSILSKNDPDAFINKEEFPVRITHALFGLRTYDDGTIPEERLLQKAGVRMVFHDQYYQSRAFAPVPMWVTEVTAGAPALSQGFSTYTFDRPVILSARDSLRVQVALESDPDGSQRVSVAVHGVGLQSKRPYFFSSFRDLNNTTPIVLPQGDFRNDGAEPVALTDLVIATSAPTGDFVGAGDIRTVRLQVAQLGNGTGRNWCGTPILQSSGATIPQMPAHLWGMSQGRAVVHRFPGQGLLWEPNEGVTMEAVALDTDAADEDLLICLAGYISLT